MTDSNSTQERTLFRTTMAIVAVGFLGLAFWLTRGRHEPPQEPDWSKIAPLKHAAIGRLENQDFDAAAADFEQLAEWVPSERLAFQNLAVARLLAVQPENRRPDASAEQLQQAVDRAGTAVVTLLERFPGAVDSRLLSARFALILNDQRRAMQELQLAAETDPLNPSIQFEIYAAARDATDEAGQAQGRAALKRCWELSPSNLYVMTEWLLSQSKSNDDTIKATLEAAKPMLAPFVEKVKKFVRIDLHEHIDATLKVSDWGKIRGNVAMLVNVLRPEVARQLDEKRVSKHLLEFVVHDFSAALAAKASPSQSPFAKEIPVKLEAAKSGLPKLAGLRSVRLLDFDLDGRVDVCAVQEDRLTVFGQAASDAEWTEMAATALPNGTRGAACFDIDRDRTVLVGFKTADGGECADALLDVVSWGADGLQTWKHEVDPLAKTRKLTAVVQSESFQAIKDVLTVLPVDFDHDGDLDLVVSAKSGLSLWLNRDDFSFGDATPFSSLPLAEAGIHSMIAVDWNRNVSIDVLCLGAKGAGVLENVLHGQFRWQELKADKLPFEGASSFAVLDADANFSWDVLVAGPQSVLYGRTTNPDAGVVKFIGTESVAENKAAGLLTWDFDNDGFVDVLNWSGSKLQTLRGGSGAFKAHDALTVDVGAAIVAVDVEDLDHDGDLDVAVATADGIKLLTNAGGNANHSLRLPIRAEDAKEAQRPSERVNMHGIGSLLELKAGRLYQPQVVTRQWTHFGLGSLKQADAVRVLWTNGVPEHWLAPQPGQSIGMQQKLKGSCPYLYCWDGEKFAFFTDCLWAAPIGLQLADGVLAPCRDWEYLKIDGDKLVAKDGEYRLKMTEELWEVGYIDSVRLLAIDHPAEVEIFSNEKVGPPSIAEFKLHTVQQPRSPIAAVDQLGRDVLAQVATRDEVYLKAFDRRIKQGLAEPHFVELSLGALESPKELKLFLTGWVRPTDTSLNIAISQRPDLESTQPPSVWVPDAKGEWQQVRPFMGFPGGKTKTIVVDLSGLFPTNDYRVRIATTMELFWDHIFFTTDEAAIEVVQSEMPLLGASLRYRGFSTLIPPVGFGPDRYDYARVSPLVSWPPLDGRLTPYGDVTGFVQAQDNRQVTIGAGDEMELRFAVAGSGPKPGWKRDFILHNVGWDKDADLNTVFGQTIDPLPFVGMSGYPDPNGPGDQPPFANQVRRQDRTKFWRLFFE